jgi:SAM-dependent methyltransferase
MAKQKTPVESAQDWTLTEEQATAVDLLASGKTLSEIAVALDVPRQTISEWCRSHAGVQAELKIRRQELWTGTTDRLRALLPEALEVLAEELKGENRLHAAVHVLKFCRLYGAELPIGSMDVGEIVVTEKERVKERSPQQATGNRNIETIIKNYVTHLEQLTGDYTSKEEALRQAVGGEFIAIGKIERDLLIGLGLQSDHTVVDVGCGSGRLAFPLARFLTQGRYFGFDVVPELVEHAQTITQRPDWTFQVTNGTQIPVPDETTDVVCFFSVFTHLMHEDTYRYLCEAKRVLRPGGKVVFSFLEFALSAHWNTFQLMVENTQPDHVHNQFISRDGIAMWAQSLGLEVIAIHDGDKPHIALTESVQWDNGMVTESQGNLGQSVAVLTKPLQLSSIARQRSVQTDSAD